MTIVLFANSPGEIASWVKPLVDRINSLLPIVRLIIVTPPCQWRSGGETNYCAGLANVIRIIQPGAYLRYLVQPGSIPEFNHLRNPSVIIYLGGELFYPLVLQQRTRVPMIGYRQDAHYPVDRFHRLFVSSEQVRDLLLHQGSDGSKIEVIGNLMIDACPPPSPAWRQRFDPKGHSLIVSLFPGSRKPELRYMLPFFIKTVESMVPTNHSVRFFLVLSPFFTIENLEQMLSRLEENRKTPSLGTFSRTPFPVIETRNGTTIEVVHGHHHEIMAASDLMITIPGTKTMEAAFYGTPMLVIAPLERAEEINIGGPVDFLPYLPVLGKPLKRYLVQRSAHRFPFTALPNILSQTFIVPEMVGMVTPIQVAQEATDLLNQPDRREIMRQSLPRTTGPKGAALRIAEYCTELLAQQMPEGSTGKRAEE